MRRVLLAATLLVLGTAAAGAAGKNPRDANIDVSYLIPEPVTQTGQIAAWLRRLAGRYRVEGAVSMPARGTFEPLRGNGDCAVVGTGAGMHCIFDIAWQDIFDISLGGSDAGVFNLPGGVAWLSPAMMLIGLDPGKQGLSFLVVDHKGLPEAGWGSIAGDRATLRAGCVNAPNLFLSMRPSATYEGRRPDTCERITRIDARAGSSLVNMLIDIEINGDRATTVDVTLRRVSPDDAAGLQPLRRRR